MGHARLPVGIDAAQVEQRVFRAGQHRSAAGLVDDDLSGAADVAALGVGVEGAFRGAFVPAAVKASQFFARVGVDVDVAADVHARIQLPYLHTRGEADEFVPVLAPVEVDFPAGVLGPDGDDACGEFHALITDLAGVDQLACGAGGLVDGDADDLVGRARVVVGGVERPKVVEQPRFESHFVALDVLGFDVWVLDRTRKVVGAGEAAGRINMIEAVGRGVVAYVGPRTAHLEQVDPRGLVAEVEYLVDQDAGAYRGVEIGVVAAGKGTRPVVAAGDVEEEHILPREVDQSVETVDRLVAAPRVAVWDGFRVADLEDVVLLQAVLGRKLDVLVVVDHVVAAK